MRLVLDCNVVIAAGVTRGVCAQVVVTAIRRHDLVLSDDIWAEYRDVASRPKLRRARARLDEILAALEAVALWVEPVNQRFDLPDPDDEIYLRVALAGGADALVTGNRRHFPLQRYGAVAIFSPRAFLELEMPAP